MPLEEFFLMSVKELFVKKLKMKIGNSKDILKELSLTYVYYTAVIDGVEHKAFLGLSAKCLNQIHIKMNNEQIEDISSKPQLAFFLKEVASLLMVKMRGYINILDSRKVTLRGPTICKGKEKTVYGITRNFLLDGEVMSVSY